MSTKIRAAKLIYHTSFVVVCFHLRKRRSGMSWLDKQLAAKLS